MASLKLSIWVTNECNMRCKYCYEDSSQGKDIDIDENDYVDSLIRFIQMATQNIPTDRVFIKLFGGEPFLQYELMKRIVDEINYTLSEDLKIYISITTNGTLLDREKIKWMNDNDIECALSIDGNSESFIENRKLKNGKNPWSVIDENIEILSKSGVRLSARMTYNSTLINDISKNLEYVIKRGFTQIKIVPDYFENAWSNQKISELHTQLKNVYEIKDNNKEIFINIEDHNLYHGKEGCTGGKTLFSINRDGNIYPCTYVVGNTEFKLGNMYEINKITDLIEICTKNNHRKVCNGCAYYECCSSRHCVYSNYNATGKFGEPSFNFCEYQKILYSISEENHEKKI